MSEKEIHGYFINGSAELDFEADVSDAKTIHARREGDTVTLALGNLTLEIPADVVPKIKNELARP